MTAPVEHKRRQGHTSPYADGGPAPYMERLGPPRKRP